MGYDIQAEREEKERQVKRTAARKARIDRMKKGKLALLYADTKVFLLDLFGNLQEYREERKLSKCRETDNGKACNTNSNINTTLCKCQDCGKEISKRAESCPGCGAPLRRKTGCGCGGCLVLCFLGFIFLFGQMLLSFDRKPVLPSAPPANNTVSLPEKPVILTNTPVEINTNQFQDVIQEKKFTGKWYEGGSLHHADLETWKKASYDNKLATAADWAFVTPLLKRVFYQSRDTDTIKPFAMELVECIDKATDGIDTTDKTYEIAAICSVSMGWQE